MTQRFLGYKKCEMIGRVPNSRNESSFSGTSAKKSAHKWLGELQCELVCSNQLLLWWVSFKYLQCRCIVLLHVARRGSFLPWNCCPHAVWGYIDLKLHPIDQVTYTRRGKCVSEDFASFRNWLTESSRISRSHLVKWGVLQQHLAGFAYISGSWIQLGSTCYEKPINWLYCFRHL